MNTRLGTAIEALRKIRDTKAPDVFRLPEVWCAAYARQIAADTLAQIETIESRDEQMRSAFVRTINRDG